MSGIEDWYEPSDELLSVRKVTFKEKYPDMKHQTEQSENKKDLIEINDVNLDYQVDHGVVHALDQISFNIFPGEFICVLGPSGCGKSTLLKILAGFIEPTSGSVQLEGEKIKGTDWHRGVVFQNPPLFEWYSVRDNISFGPKMRKVPKAEYKKLTDEYLEKVGLTEFADKHIYELSGGMKQRVSIARALINNPDILLMDEPYGALDALTRQKMQDLIRRIWWNTGKTILFITHDVEEALLLASRIIVLSKRPGRVIEDIPVHFSRQIVEENQQEIQFSEPFYKYRERLLKLIHSQE